jgi:exonuclease III
MGKGYALAAPTTTQEKTVQSTMSKELRSKDNYFQIISQNINGLKQHDKIDAIVNIMQTNNIDIYLAQETWLEGEENYKKQIEVHNTLIFFYGNREITCRRGRGGVAIFLGARAQKAWHNAGSKQPSYIEPTENDIVRIMGMQLRINRPGGHCNLTINSIYHPHDGKGTTIIENFYDRLNDYLQDIKENQNIIIGADTNTPLGTKNSTKNFKNLIGKYGIATHRENQNYYKLNATMERFKLRAANTDFKAKRYDTWSGPINSHFEGNNQLDYIFMSNNIRRHVMRCAQSGLGVESDHAAVKIKMRFYFRKNKKG